jgi:Ca-activated chloride channel family protein
MSSLRTLAALIFAALFVACRSADAQEASQQTSHPNQPIQVTVDRVNVGVIVTDRNGHFIEGLHRDDFHVLDNGTEQPLTGFADVEEPAQVLLLIEAGPAVYLLESGHLLAASALLNGLARDDRIAVVKYADAPEGLLDFTADKDVVLSSFGQLRFNLGFGSLNLSSSVSKVLEWLAGVRGKKTIVLLSTGVDTSPENAMEATLQTLRVSDIRLLAVSLTGGLQIPRATGKKNSPATTPPAADSLQTAQQFAQAAQLLKQMAESTGGRAYFPSNKKELDATYAEIAQLVRHEYSLAFAPPQRDGAVHTIQVHLTPALPSQKPNTPAPDYRLDHRQAYRAPAPKQ